MDADEAQGVSVAVPVTVPEGCVGSLERRVRVKVQEEVRLVKMVVEMLDGEDFGGGSFELGVSGTEGSCGSGRVSRIGM